MKKLFVILAGAAVLASCTNSGKSSFDFKAAQEEFTQKADAIWSDTTITDFNQQMQIYMDLLKETYLNHLSDSLGLSVFPDIVHTELLSYDELQALYEKAKEPIKGNAKIERNLLLVKNAEAIVAGTPFIEVTGTDALTGDSLSLSSFIGKDGKPLIVDFWASWCRPCRNEIKNNLLDIAAKGEVNIVGIAVWEDSVEDTRKAMEELGISWPVIYTGGRDDSPSVIYGVSGIPTLFEFAADGTLIAKGHSVEGF